VSDPAAIYPTNAVAQAKNEMTKAEPRGRRVTRVFTPEVVAVWLGWLDNDVPITWIAEHNGLMPTTYETVNRYIDKHRAAAERIRRSEGRTAETAVAQPSAALVDTEPEKSTVMKTAVAQPALEQETDKAPTEEPAQPETALETFTPEKPENLPAFLDRDYAPARPPGPGDALATLAALVNNEQLRVKGSVKLNLEIEFGE